MTDEPYSTWSSLAYPVAGALVVWADATLESFVLAALMIGLGLATFAFHLRWTPLTSDLDHAAMNATLAGLATLAVGAPWYLMVVGAAAAVYLEVGLDWHNYPLMFAFGWCAVAGAVAQGAWDAAGAGVLFILLALAAWSRKGEQEDIYHALWHFFSAVGMMALIAGILS